MNMADHWLKYEKKLLYIDQICVVHEGFLCSHLLINQHTGAYFTFNYLPVCSNNSSHFSVESIKGFTSGKIF